MFAFLEDQLHVHYAIACLQDELVPCYILYQHLANRCAQSWTSCSLT